MPWTTPDTMNWPKWPVFEEAIRSGDILSAYPELVYFKQQILKASVRDLDQVSKHATMMWDFLLRYASEKKANADSDWSALIMIFNRLMLVPSWIDAWEKNPEFKGSRMKALHEDMQAALGAQNEVLLRSIPNTALKSVARVRPEWRPERILQSMRKECMIDAIQEEEDEEEAAASTHMDLTSPEAALADWKAGVKAVCNICSSSSAEVKARALNKMRIACIRSAGHEGQEEVFVQDIGSAVRIFSFLLDLAENRPGNLSGVAEVMNQLMASATWSVVFMHCSALKKKLGELPKKTQKALGQQSDQLMSLITADAKNQEVPQDIEGLAEKMSAIRTASVGGYSGGFEPPSAPANSMLQAPSIKKAWWKPASMLQAPAIKKDLQAPLISKALWKAVKTSEGHTYYVNCETKESTWTRPDSLGGPIEYKVGDAVEVWSGSKKKWGKGKVTKVADEQVSAEFTFDGVATMSKQLPAQHKDLRKA